MKLPQDLRWKPTGKTLGEGGQGRVVQVEDRTSELPGVYALKALSPNRPRKAFERFAREVEALRTLEHSSIVRIVDNADPGANFPYYVMEYIEGARTLRSLIGTSENPFEGNARRGLELCAALISVVDACTAKGILHRDLSPANILILPDLNVKVIDFGLCQLLETEVITLADEGIGTRNFLAPECEAGAGGDASIQSELYSVGKILWSAVTNSNAFARESPVFGDWSMKMRFPNVPALWHLHHVFEKTIRHDPAHRWAACDPAAKLVGRLIALVDGGYPPLELMDVYCPCAESVH